MGPSMGPTRHNKMKLVRRQVRNQVLTQVRDQMWNQIKALSRADTGASPAAARLSWNSPTSGPYQLEPIVMTQIWTQIKDQLDTTK